MKLECSSATYKNPACFFFLCLIVGLLTIYYSRSNGNVWSSSLTYLRSGSSYKIDGDTSTSRNILSAHGTEDDPFGPVNFDINGSDVMVFLHIQKTGGTELGRHFVKNMILPKECDTLVHKKRKNCLRPNSDVETWIFSRYSTGWLCGLHAGWTELHECVSDKLNEVEKITKNRTFFYVTLLRDPVRRFVSEWRHVQRGATWKSSKFSCQGKANDIPHCYEGDSWEGVSLKEFMGCPYNMGVNRQTWMLADLHLVNCYRRWLDRNMTVTEIEELEQKMLESAMKNLKEMAFFGIVEEQVKMQKLFEYTFPFKFKKDFVQYNVTIASESAATQAELDDIRLMNTLDYKLYEYARKLFFERYDRMASTKQNL